MVGSAVHRVTERTSLKVVEVVVDIVDRVDVGQPDDCADPGILETMQGTGIVVGVALFVLVREPYQPNITYVAL